jgi:hypothetical protein
MSSVVPFVAPIVQSIPSQQEQEQETVMPFLLYVCYDEKTWHFWESKMSTQHQLVALNEFVRQQTAQAWISVPHGLGGWFSARFQRLAENQVCYYKENGQRVVFQIQPNWSLQQ